MKCFAKCTARATGCRTDLILFGCFKCSGRSLHPESKGRAYEHSASAFIGGFGYPSTGGSSLEMILSIVGSNVIDAVRWHSRNPMVLSTVESKVMNHSHV